MPRAVGATNVCCGLAHVKVVGTIQFIQSTHHVQGSASCHLHPANRLMTASARSVTWYSWEQMPRESVAPLLERRLITGDRMMIAHVYLKKGMIVPKHQHENEQITYIIDGVLKFWIGEDESQVVFVRAGEVLHIPS